MADAFTSRLGLTKPEDGGSDGAWGPKLNTNFDLLDDHPGIRVVADEAARLVLTPFKGQVVFQADANVLYKCIDANVPVWQLESLQSIFAAEGDLLYMGATEPARLGKGTAKQVLRMNTGVNAPEWADNTRGIAFYIDGDLSLLLKAAIVIPCNLTITNVKAKVGAAPSGASLILDILKNGVTVFTTTANRPAILSGETSVDSAAPDVADLLAGDQVTLSIVQVGSIVPGADLAATIICEVT